MRRWKQTSWGSDVGYSWEKGSDISGRSIAQDALTVDAQSLEGQPGDFLQKKVKVAFGNKNNVSECVQTHLDFSSLACPLRSSFKEDNMAAVRKCSGGNN